MQDWNKLDVKKVAEESGSKGCSTEDIRAACNKFGQLVEERRPVTHFCNWITGLVETHAKPAAAAASPASHQHQHQQQQQQASLVARMRRLLSTWHPVTAKLLQQLQVPQRSSTVASASST